MAVDCLAGGGLRSAQSPASPGWLWSRRPQPVAAGSGGQQQGVLVAVLAVALRAKYCLRRRKRREALKWKINTFFS